MKNFFILVALFGFCLSTAQAQNDTVFLMNNQNVVNFTDGAAFDELADKAMIPVLKSLVADSMIIGWGFTDHAWGDEWNKGWWIVATSHETFLAAFGKYIARINEQHPGALAEMDKLVRRHKDDLYIIRDSNTGGPSGAIMLQQSIVPLTKLGDWNAFMRDKSAPVLEEMLAEGLITGYGNLNHRWGSEWNTGFYLSAANVGGTFDAWGTFTTRMGERHPGWFQEAASMIEMHKDNIYSVRVQG